MASRITTIEKQEIDTVTRQMSNAALLENTIRGAAMMDPVSLMDDQCSYRQCSLEEELRKRLSGWLNKG
jgi:hypothetical protein